MNGIRFREQTERQKNYLAYEQIVIKRSVDRKVEFLSFLNKLQKIQAFGFNS